MLNIYKEFGISDEVANYGESILTDLKGRFEEIDCIAEYNQLKVIKAMQDHRVAAECFNTSTGYGYGDVGRDTLEEVYKNVFKGEDALVRPQITCGTHALALALMSNLRPGDELLSPVGKPYDTLEEVIGIRPSKGSLAEYNISYRQVDLIDNKDFDYDKIKEIITNNKIKLIEIQRSKGYSTRKSITLDKVSNIIKFIKNIDKDIIIMIDNCYCEFVGVKEPTEVGADIVVGSLIKNLGGGIAPNGAYIVGRHDLIKLCGERLTLPGEGKEVGPTLGINKQLLQGIYMAPSVVASSLKTAILTSKVLEHLGYDVEPKYDDERVDIVQNIIFRDPNKLIEFTRGIQEGSAIDSNALVEPGDMPGYTDKIIMASGSFTQGSSIELSCDGPIREPYIAYMQGSLTYQYGKIGLMKAIDNLLKKCN